MLTAKQRELLLFIDNRLKESGISPSFDEMREALELKSKSGVHRLISALEERGFIRRLPNRARALEVVKLPESSVPGLATIPSQRGFRPNVIEGNLGRVRAAAAGPADEDAARSVLIPVMGRIAAGTPVPAVLGDWRRLAWGGLIRRHQRGRRRPAPSPQVV